MLKAMGQTVTVGTDGSISVVIDHCSVYALLSTVAVSSGSGDGGGSGSGTIIAVVVIIAVLIALVAVYFLVLKKKQ